MMTYKDDILDLSLLYVEDDELSRTGIFNILKRKVRTIYFARDGREGLELFNKHRPEVVITDIKMPILNGLEMAREILEQSANVKIMIATAFEDIDLFKKAIDLGINQYLIKPLDTLQILSHLKRIEAEKICERECDISVQILNKIGAISWFDSDFKCIKQNQNALNHPHNFSHEELQKLAHLATNSHGKHVDSANIFHVIFGADGKARGYCLCTLL